MRHSMLQIGALMTVAGLVGVPSHLPPSLRTHERRDHPTSLRSQFAKKKRPKHKR